MLLLARTLHCSVSEIERMPVSEFDEWRAEYEMEPWGEWRADLRNAMLCQVVARAGGLKKTKVEHFMPTFRTSAPPETGAALKLKVKAAFARAGV